MVVDWCRHSIDLERMRSPRRIGRTRPTNRMTVSKSTDRIDRPSCCYLVFFCVFFFVTLNLRDSDRMPDGSRTLPPTNRAIVFCFVWFFFAVSGKESRSRCDAVDWLLAVVRVSLNSCSSLVTRPPLSVTQSFVFAFSIGCRFSFVFFCVCVFVSGRHRRIDRSGSGRYEIFSLLLPAEEVDFLWFHNNLHLPIFLSFRYYSLFYWVFTEFSWFIFANFCLLLFFYLTFR